MHAMLSSIGALLAGGTAGVLARWLVTGWLPCGTVAVNLSGCFLMGAFDAAASKRGFGGPHGRALVLAGFCGAYTTFSALIFELDGLLRTAPLKGGAYLVVSVAAGLALFRFGAFVGAR